MKLKTYTGEEVKTIRKAMMMSQTNFWKPLGVGQSGSSRYESGRSIPRPVQILLNLALSPEEKAVEMFAELRRLEPKAARKAMDAERSKGALPEGFGVLP